MSATELPETITYWLVTGNNGTGGLTWAAGVAIPARVARVSRGVVDREGKTTIFSDAVYAETDIPIGAYIFLGDEDGVAEPVEGARRVIDSVTNPTMSTLSRMVI